MQNRVRTSHRSLIFCLVLISIGAIIAEFGPKATTGGYWASGHAFSAMQPELSDASVPGEPANGSSRVAAGYRKIPMAFEENQGQTDSRVRFFARGADYALFLTDDAAVLAMKPASPASAQAAEGSVVAMRLVDANSQAAVTGMEQLPGKTNYFIGNDPEKWRTNVATYAKVRYRDVYPGVDLVYYGSQGQLEYDFVLAPGADPSPIRLAFSGTETAGRQPTQIRDPKFTARNSAGTEDSPVQHSINLAENGDLVVNVRGTSVRFHQPVIYQISRSPGVESRTQVEGRYVLTGETQVAFQLGAYDRTRPLVIDPALAYSTYLGGSQDDAGKSIALDDAGNVYVTGNTCSTNFPIVGGFQKTFGGYSGTNCSSTNLFGNLAGGDAFVVKFDPTLSTILYSTYLGGGGADVGNGIAVNSAGNAFITGGTCSSGTTAFPTTHGAFQTTYAGGFSPCVGDRGDAFVTELDANGSALVYSTYLGGSSGDTGNAIAVDASDNAYVIGTTCSSNFPTTVGALQTHYGGDSGKCGSGPQGDVFVTKLNPSGSALVYSTYLGGSSGDTGYGLALDSSNNAYLAGYTYSTNFPVTAGAYDTVCKGCSQGLSQAFVAKLNSTGTKLDYSTYLGGTTGTEPCAACATGIAVNSSGNAFVVGLTSYKDFPILHAFQPQYGGGAHDQFVTELNSTGSGLIYSTFLGGSVDDGGNAIAIDSNGRANIRGDTNSANFPTTPGAFQTVCSGGCPLGTYSVTMSVIGATGSSLSYSTFLGGSGTNFGKANHSLALNSSGIYLTGFTNSTSFPVTTRAYQSKSGGGYDAFVTNFGSASNVSLSASALNFGSHSVGTTSARQTITLTNIGEIALDIHSITIVGADPSDFLEATGCGSTLGAGATCSIQVAFKPMVKGTLTATLSVTDNGGDSPQIVTLTGSGT